MVLLHEKLWGIWVYTWVRGIVIPGLGFFVCLFVVWVWVYPFFFGGVPPSFVCVLFVGGPVLPPVRPRGGRVGFLPCVGVSALSLKGGLSWLLLFLSSRLLLLVLLCLVWCRACLGVLAPLLSLSLSVAGLPLLVGFVVLLLLLCLRWLRCCVRLVLRVLLFPCVLVVVGLLPRSSVRCLLLLLLLWVSAWLLLVGLARVLSSVLCVPKAFSFCSLPSGWGWWRSAFASVNS